MQKAINNPVRKKFNTLLKVLQQVKKLRWSLLLVFAMATQVSAQTTERTEFTGSDYNSPIQKIEEVKATKGKGWQLKTKGGLEYINPQDEDYWVAIGGVIRLDETFYSGTFLDKQGQFPNSALIRRIEPGIDGGLGKNWEYSFNIQFSNYKTTNLRGSFGFVNGLVAIVQDTWLGYTGFSDNSELFFGRLSGNWFGLENSTGASWMRFMERSMQANMFYPGDGLGLMYDMWWQDAGITLILLEHDQGSHLTFTNPFTDEITRFGSDRLRAVARGTYAPGHCLGDVWHFGLSGTYRRLDSVLFGVPVREGVLGPIAPGGFAHRNAADAPALVINQFATYAYEWNVELARQWGPFLLEGEYTQAFLHRVMDPQGQGSLRAKGWNLQASYVLTGEPHSYDVRDGSFGSIDICSPYGAWEAAVRYEYTNLNDKNVHGGSQHAFTAGLNWFITTQLRLTFNYVRSSFRAADIPNVFGVITQPAIRRRIDAFGVRLQLKFK